MNLPQGWVLVQLPLCRCILANPVFIVVVVFHFKRVSGAGYSVNSASPPHLVLFLGLVLVEPVAKRRYYTNHDIINQGLSPQIPSGIKQIV